MRVSGRTVFLLPRVGPPAGLGGLAGADARCQDAADDAGLQGTYMAWLSVSAAASAAGRFSHDGGPFFLTDGTEIALDWGDLTDGTLAAPILVAADGMTYDPGSQPETFVITHTNIDGTGIGDFGACVGFSAAQGVAPIVGIASETGPSWTFGGETWPCGDGDMGGPSLYCFEQ